MGFGYILNNAAVWVGLFSATYAASGSLRIAMGALTLGCVITLIMNK